MICKFLLLMSEYDKYEVTRIMQLIIMIVARAKCREYEEFDFLPPSHVKFNS